MGSDWQETTIGALVEKDGGDIQTGPFGTRLKAAEYTEEGVPVISVGEVQFGRLVVHEKTPKVPPSITERMPEYLLREGDIVFGRKGAVERSGLVTTEQDGWFLGSDGIRVRLPSCCIARFVSYQFLSHAHRNWMIQQAAGTTMPSLNESIVKRIPIRLPSRAKQKAIAHILGTLDDKIELNRRMNETLESMARALFKSWFVDFDPVIDNALAAGNSIPEPLAARGETRCALGPARKPLPENIRSLFPATFAFDEEMGWIPAGWEAGPISRLASLNEKSWSAKSHPETIEYVDLGNAKHGTVEETEHLSFEDAPSRAKRVLQEDDTIVGTVRPGNRSFAYIHRDGLTGSTGFAVLTPTRKTSRSFVYLSITQDVVISEFARLADGAAYPAIRPDVVGDWELVLPSDDLVGAFDETSSKLLHGIGRRLEQNAELAKLRDTLLPKLLSGELRIPEAEKLVADSV